MSKYLKNLIATDVSDRLRGVQDAVLVNVVGMTANHTVQLRRELRDKNIQLLVVKNSMAQRACEGTSLAPAFEGCQGSNAIVWGAEDFISLTKEIARIDKEAKYTGFATSGGVMDGEKLTPERVHEISKWPNRLEQLAILSGQILSPASQLSAALLAAGGALASQIEKVAEGEGPHGSAQDSSVPEQDPGSSDSVPVASEPPDVEAEGAEDT
jgi:large subunit ribosomal protein L10